MQRILYMFADGKYNLFLGEKSTSHALAAIVFATPAVLFCVDSGGFFVVVFFCFDGRPVHWASGVYSLENAFCLFDMFHEGLTDPIFCHQNLCSCVDIGDELVLYSIRA